MNLFKVKVISIKSVQNIHIIKFDFYGNTLSMMELGKIDDIKVGSDLELFAKSTNIAISKSDINEVKNSLSYSNTIEAKILSIEDSSLLSSIKLELNNKTIESLITLDSRKRLDLRKNDTVVALIKASELSIHKVI